MLHTYIYRSTTLHITYRPDIRTNVMSIICSIVILYTKYLAPVYRSSAGTTKMFRDRTEATMFWPGTVPVPVPVLYLQCWHKYCQLENSVSVPHTQLLLHKAWNVN